MVKNASEPGAVAVEVSGLPEIPSLPFYLNYLMLEAVGITGFVAVVSTGRPAPLVKR